VEKIEEALLDSSVFMVITLEYRQLILSELVISIGLSCLTYQARKKMADIVDPQHHQPYSLTLIVAQRLKVELRYGEVESRAPH
jgi:hypothetical protein